MTRTEFSTMVQKELTLEDQVLYGALTTLAREVGHRLKRAAHSSLIRESDDYGAAIVSAQFELLAEAELPAEVRDFLSSRFHAIADHMRNRPE